MTSGNLNRFSGFADLYDANRPAVPDRLGPLLASYAGVTLPDVVDLGSGTGLSTRWAARWARGVIGIEPNTDMRAQAETHPLANVRYTEGTSDATGLAEGCADIVVAVQAMHWMEPVSTHAEIVRILRPGGVLAIIDADWPPVTGVVDIERAWALVHARMRVFEAREARGLTDDALHAPVSADDPALVDEDLADPHRNRLIPGGVQSWSKSEHLRRIRATGAYDVTRELFFDEPVTGGAARCVALMRSQGSYQGLRRIGITDADLGMSQLEEACRSISDDGLRFCWRVRLGVTHRT